MSIKRRGLFINNKKAQDSIYESGLMVFNCLQLSEQYQLDYIEIDINRRIIPGGYDFYFFNYHPSTMGWMDTSKLKKTLGLVITMVLEVLPNDPFVMCPDNHFHGYCVLDPTLRSKNKKVFAFPRPLEIAENVSPYIEKKIPVIGSFGFATKGKGFQHVVEAVNKEFEQAIVRINIPYGDFVPDSEKYAKFLSDLCKQKAKPGIEVIVTHDYMDKRELIKWCSENTLNCFLYDRNIPGLAATTDQAIVSERPLAVSRNDTFRHILTYIPPYPEISLRDSIEKSIPMVLKMKRDWSPSAFVFKFEEMISVLTKKYYRNAQAKNDFEIPLIKKTFVDKLKKRYRKYKRFLNPGKIKYALATRNKGSHEELI
jgi:hypothetical protein